MKINKIITLFFFLIFGYTISSLRKEIILKNDLSEVNSGLLNLVLKIDFIAGFIYPLAFFIFFYLLFSFSSFIVIDKKINNLSDILVLSMLPNFIFIVLNYNYVIDMNSDELETIILNQTRAIIPFLSYKTSLLVSDYLVYAFPPLVLLFYLTFKEKTPLINNFLIAVMPIIIVFITYNILS